MAKKQKIARVRYIPEGESNFGEGYALEMETENGWGLICQTQLRHCAEYPDAKEKEFIHYTFMNEIFQLLNLGYHVYRC